MDTTMWRSVILNIFIMLFSHYNHSSLQFIVKQFCMYLRYTMCYLNILVNSKMYISADELMSISSQRSNYCFVVNVLRMYCLSKLYDEVGSPCNNQASRYITHAWNLWPCVSPHLPLTLTALTVLSFLYAVKILFCV